MSLIGQKMTKFKFTQILCDFKSFFNNLSHSTSSITNNHSFSIQIATACLPENHDFQKVHFSIAFCSFQDHCWSKRVIDHSFPPEYLQKTVFFSLPKFFLHPHFAYHLSISQNTWQLIFDFFASKQWYIGRIYPTIPFGIATPH